MTTHAKALEVSEKLSKTLTDRTLFNGFGVQEDKDKKGSFVAMVYLAKRKIPKNSVPAQVDGVKIVPMYLGAVKPQGVLT